MVGDDQLFDLGDDVAILILIRLPVDDLCRFLCVSKRWYSTISSPSFNILHHRDHPFSCISCGFLYHLVDSAQSSTRALDISQLEAIPCRRHEYEHSLPSLLLDRLLSMTLDASQQLLLADTHSGVVLFIDKDVQPEHYLLKFEGFILLLDLEEKTLEVVREIENELPQFHTAFACVIPYKQPLSPIKMPDVN